MACNICSKLPDILEGKVTITMNLIDDTFRDILDSYLSNQVDYEYINDIIINIYVDSLEKFISDLGDSDIFNDKIMETIMVTYKGRDDGKIDEIKNFTSLSKLYYLIKGKDLLYTLRNGKLNIYFQPIIDIKKDEIYGYECLLRGKKPDGSPYPPSEMFGIAKRNDLIYFLDRTARQLALKKAKERNIDKNLFINFMPSAIYDPKYCLESTISLAKDLGFSGDNIIFEVVESEKAEDTEKLKDILKYYKENGFKVAIDDMGKGYSTLSLLSQLLPDIMKIDIEIIKNIHEDTLKQSIFNALIDIAKENNIKVLAEGIESRKEFDFVKKRGVDYAQGYYFGRPEEIPSKKLGI